jgi:hypothetical protein
MNPSDLTSATAAQHVDDLRAAARHARLAALVRGCRETTIERTARLLRLDRHGSDTCGS